MIRAEVQPPRIGAQDLRPGDLQLRERFAEYVSKPVDEVWGDAATRQTPAKGLPAVA